MKHGKKIIGCSVLAMIAVVIANYGDEIRTSERGLAIIGNAEGCYRTPYHCPAGVLTVGIGSTAAGGEPIVRNKTYTDKEIADRWVQDIKSAERCVNRWANGDNLPQGAFEAATSIAFNVGCDKLKYSTLFKYARAGNIKAMCEQYPRWVYAGGKVLPGLVTRRARERKLCLS